jgi:methylenetetrahydrofolate dehydrogenase (NADP+) / methenyltetrahydrofolate cyclohydrolase
MMSRLLEGKWVRDRIFTELRPRIERLAARHRRPALDVVLVGHDPGSEIYVRNKVRACADLGIASRQFTPPDSISTEELLALVNELNGREETDGILVQMPLPRQVNSKLVLDAIAPEKDVDGFHPYNVGNLVANIPGPRPCTPAGVMEILRHYEIPVEGKRAVVVGRSDIVGKPMSLLLLHAHATVTICHSKTPDLAGVCRTADILVAAIGRPAMITREFIREGATVIDVGINRVADRALAEHILARAPERMAVFEKNGSVVVGDVHPTEVAEVAGAYSPVPGGVGILTVAMLMANTTAIAERRLGVCSG